MTTQPPRIWIWPEQSATGVINWLKGCYRAEPRRPLDSKDGPTGAEYVPAEWMADLVDVLESLLVVGDFRRGDEDVKAARAALAKARGQA